jgi:hypothetical protein
MITITKFKDQRGSTIGAFTYWHLIQYPHSTHRYDCTMTDEGMMYLIEHLKLAGNEVTYIIK